MTQIEKLAIYHELIEQDKMLHEIENRRRELGQKLRKAGCYQEMWDAVFEDGEAHHGF